MSENKNIVTEEVRFNFPNVFRPGKKLNPDDDEKFSLVVLFPAGYNLTSLKKMAVDAIVEKWGSDKAKWPTNLRTPFRDQGEKPDMEGYVSGSIFINARSSQRPGVVDGNLNDIIDESEIYSGCYGKVSLRAFAYDRRGNKGVAFGLQNVQKTKDGESLGGRVNPQDEFKPVEGTESSDSDTDIFG